MADAGKYRRPLVSLSNRFKDPRVSAATVVCVLLLLTCQSYAVLLLVSFVGGLILGYIVLSPSVLFPNLLVSHVRPLRPAGRSDELSLIKKVCTVCGKEKCERHRPELNVVALKPWININIPEKVNSALEEFFNLVVKEFILTWYRDLSEDEGFIDEIRHSLRFIVCVLLRRLEKVDIPSLITGRVLSTALIHLHYGLQVTKKGIPAADVEQSVLDLYGCHLHCAVRNRRSELDYLKQISDKVFPHVLPPHSIKCKSLCVLLREVLSGAILLPAMDVLADPDIVNNILLLLFDKSPLRECADPPSPMVPILGFSNALRPKSDMNLQLSLSDILADNDLLYPFMQFMKSEASVNVLQFYLSIEEFNGEILTPELSQQQCLDLHKTLRDLYNNYIDPSSVNCIGFDDEIVSQLKLLCEGDADGVVKLQTTTPLFKAYEHAYDLLEHTFLPLFHQSDEYYSMLCGKRLSSRLQRTMSKSSKNPGDQLSFSGIGNRIKTAFRGSTVEGRPLSEGVEYMEIGCLATSLSDNGVEVLQSPPAIILDDGPLRDLSAWRVSIPEIVMNKNVAMFHIEVRRVDVLENDFEASRWFIDRRYHEFYVLEQKLVEFHGEFEDAHLPSKRTFFVQKSKAFLESQQESFEQYLQKLLTKPVLRGSELLYSFLYTDTEFTTGFLEVNLGKKVKSGAMKLVKERGQHLDSFLRSFLLSTENPKSRPCRWSDRDSDAVSISSEKMSNSIYNNNANCDLEQLPTSQFCKSNSAARSDASVDEINGVYDAVIYLVMNLYSAPFWLLRLLLALRTIVRNSVDAFLDWYLGRKLDKVFQEYHLVKIIHLLRDALFFDSDPPRTDEDKRLRQEAALSELLSFIPKVFAKAVGSDKYEKGTQLLFSFLQLPRLNKQLSYMLLDVALDELFPELVASENHEQYIASNGE